MQRLGFAKGSTTNGSTNQGETISVMNPGTTTKGVHKNSSFMATTNPKFTSKLSKTSSQQEEEIIFPSPELSQPLTEVMEGSESVRMGQSVQAPLPQNRIAELLSEKHPNHGHLLQFAHYKNVFEELSMLCQCVEYQKLEDELDRRVVGEKLLKKTQALKSLQVENVIEKVNRNGFTRDAFDSVRSTLILNKLKGSFFNEFEEMMSKRAETVGVPDLPPGITVPDY